VIACATCFKEYIMDDPHDEMAETDVVARMAERLRGAERLPDDFEAGLRSRAEPILALRAAALADRSVAARVRRWWLAPVVHLSPISSLLAAAGVAAVAADTTHSASRARPTSGGVPDVVHDTVHVLRFALRHSGARQISLVGDFNEWKATVTPMEPTGVDGLWTVSVPLPPGRHEYAFVVDGVLVPDPLAPAQRDDFDTESSVLMVTE
jgi:hypothetical protein